jgi:hypothetical protein
MGQSAPGKDPLGRYRLKSYFSRYNRLLMHIENKLALMGLLLPEPIQPPPGIELPFAWVRTFENRAYVSGHGAQNPDGTVAGPFGKVGSAVTAEQAAVSAKLALLSILSSLKKELGDLDRITRWLVVNGLRDIFNRDYGSERNAQKDILAQIQVENDRLTRARKLLLDGSIDAGDYKLIKQEAEQKLNSLEAKLVGLDHKSLNIDDCAEQTIEWIHDFRVMSLI